MDALNQAINGLSSDELDMLNSDSKMLSDFKAKYAEPPTSSGIAMDAIRAGAQMALPSQDFNKPLAPESSNPAMGAVEAAGQTLRDPTRISPSISAPGQAVGDKVDQSLSDAGHPLIGKGAGFFTSLALDPQTYAVLPEGSIGKLKNAATKGYAGFKDFLSNLVKEPATQAEINKGVSNVQDAMNKARKTIGAKLETVRNFSEGLSDEDKAKILKDKLGKMAAGEAKATSPQDLAKEYLNHDNVLSEIDKSYNTPSPEDVNEAAGQFADKYGAKTHLRNFMEEMGRLHAQDPAAAEAAIDTKFKNYTAKGEAKVGAWFPNEDIANQMKKELLSKYAEHPILSGNAVASDVSNKAKLSYLMDFKQRLSDAIKFGRTSAQAGVKPVSTEQQGLLKAAMTDINGKIGGIPGGEKIRAAEQHFSQIAGVFDDLQSKLSEPGKAEGFLKRVLTSDAPAMKDYRNKLAQLEHLSGKPIITDLQNMFKSQSGVSYETLKHPLATLAKKVYPMAGTAARSAPVMGGLGAFTMKEQLSNLLSQQGQGQ